MASRSRSEPPARTERADANAAAPLREAEREPEANTDLLTGSEAPSEVSARPLEASIGFEVRRVRGWSPRRRPAHAMNIGPGVSELETLGGAGIAEL